MGWESSFSARHQTLKRLVALKMIRGDVNADADAWRGFRREAEAVARLQHHGIVQIHDVGTHHGSPYLAVWSTSTVKTLRSVCGTTMPPRLVAALIESIAPTVHYAASERDRPSRPDTAQSSSREHVVPRHSAD